MKTRQAQTISDMFVLCSKWARFFALLLVFCISINNVYPRAIIEMKNYNVVVLAMGSQLIFLHLFALPGRVSIELANLLFGDNGKMSPLDKPNRKNAPKTNRNSSADYSILSVDGCESFRLFQLGAVYACDTRLNLTKIVFTNLPVTFGLFQLQGMLYFILLLLFFSRPRGDVSNAANKTIINNSKPGSSLKPGFLLAPRRARETRYELAD